MIYTYTIYGNMAAVIHIFSSHMDLFILLKTNNWVCYWISSEICLIAKEYRRRGLWTLTTEHIFITNSITNFMNNIEYRERFWIWLLEPIACNRNLTLGYKNTQLLQQRLTTCNCSPYICLYLNCGVYMTRCRENYKRPGMVNKDLEYCTFYHQLNVIPNLVHIGSVISEK